MSLSLEIWEQLVKTQRPYTQEVRLGVDEESLIVNDEFGLKAVPEFYGTGRTLLISVARSTAVLTPRTYERGVFKGDNGDVSEHITILAMRFSNNPLRSTAYIGDKYKVEYLGASNTQDCLFSITSTDPISSVFLKKGIQMRDFLNDLRTHQRVNTG